jgi:prepilin-type N-terminal cleavage/methylation domain-containing protein
MTDTRKAQKVKHAGFTLIELLVVVAIIGLLASIILANLSTARIRAREARRQSDMNSVIQALQLYYLEHNNLYPGNFGTDAACGNQYSCLGHMAPELVNGPKKYIGAIPKDPLNDGTANNYRYCTSNMGAITYYVLYRYDEEAGKYCVPQGQPGLPTTSLTCQNVTLVNGQPQVDSAVEGWCPS